MYFTERDEHLDLFTTDKHEAGHTTGDTVWKGALTGESRASYEGLIHILPKAPEVDTYLQTHQMLLSPKAKGDAIPSLIVEVDNVKASHGGTVGELDEEQIFYMMTRGIPRAEAVRVLVEGYFEEVVQRLDDPGLEELVRAAHRGEAGRAPRTRCASSSGSARRPADGQRRRPSRSSTSAPTSRCSTREIGGQPAGLPRLGRHVAEARAGDRGDGPLLPRVVRARSTAASTSWRARPPTRSRARATRIAAFVNWDPACSIFTRNATEAINLVAYAWGREQRRPGRRGAHHRDGAPLEHRALADRCARRPARSCATSRSPTTARAVARRARRGARRGPREAGRRRARVERARHDQPGGRDRRAARAPPAR